MNTSNKRYWIGVASKEHVKIGVAGGFSQLCHGKAQPLKRMAVGDGLIYYSSKFGANRLCQQFTAIGTVIGSDVYSYEMFPGFVHYRRDIQFIDAQDVAIRPLIETLSFIKDKTRWGYELRYGHLQIPQEDFELVAAAMLNTAAITLSVEG